MSTRSASWCDVHGEARDGDGICWSCAGYGSRTSPASSVELGEGERLLESVRQHWLVLSPAAALTLAAVVVSIILVAATPPFVAGRNVRPVELLVGGALVLIAVAVLLVCVALWRIQTFTVTTRRFILRRGLLFRVAESVLLDRVQHVELRRALFVPFGDVVIITADGAAQWAERLGNPSQFQQLLLAAVNASRRAPRDET